MTIIDHPSPNWDERPDGVKVDLVVVHGTAGATAEGDVRWLSDEIRGAEGKVYDTSASYHYVVGRDGRIWQLVDESRRAWHAGRSSWNGRDDVNDFSVGVGLSNRGVPASDAYPDGDANLPGLEAYPTAQILAAAELIVDVCERYNLPWRNVVTHAHVSPGRKTDPWLHFPWGEMAGAMLSYHTIRSA